MIVSLGDVGNQVSCDNKVLIQEVIFFTKVNYKAFFLKDSMLLQFLISYNNINKSINRLLKI